jgi:hypothetical protein
MAPAQTNRARPHRVRQSSSLMALLSVPPGASQDKKHDKKCEENPFNNIEEESSTTMEKICLW